MSTLGYEVSANYPRFDYKPNEIVWYLDQLDEVTFVKQVFIAWAHFKDQLFNFQDSGDVLVVDDTLQLHHPALDVRLPRDVDQELFKY